MENDSRQTEYINKQKRKRLAFLKKVGSFYLILALFIFIFGYDVPMFDKHKLMEFFPPFIFIFLIIIFIAYKKYRIAKLCPHCGAEIKNIKKDCITSKIEFLRTIDKTEYKNMPMTIKSKTVYPRGGYSMRNSIMEYTSESTYEIERKVPITKKYYVYNIEYRCKKCKEVFSNYEFISSKILNTKK